MTLLLRALTSLLGIFIGTALCLFFVRLPACFISAELMQLELCGVGRRLMCGLQDTVHFRVHGCRTECMYMADEEVKE